MRHFVIDFEHIAVGIGEIDAALVDMAGGAHDPDAVFDQMRIRLAQRRVAADLESDVGEPDLPALRSRSVVRRWMLADIERVKTLTQGHEDAAMFGVFLGDAEPEHVAVEPLGGLLVGDPQEHMADARQLYHSKFPLAQKVKVKSRARLTAAQAPAPAEPIEWQPSRKRSWHSPKLAA